MLPCTWPVWSAGSALKARLIESMLGGRRIRLSEVVFRLLCLQYSADLQHSAPPLDYYYRAAMTVPAADYTPTGSRVRLVCSAVLLATAGCSESLPGRVSDASDVF